MIVLNELKWAESVLSGVVHAEPSLETMIRLARYYQYTGQKTKAVRKSLEEFLTSLGVNPRTVESQMLIDRTVRVAAKNALFVSDGVVITQGELDRIENLDGWPVRRLAFTLLCLAKYLNQKRASNNGWVSTPDKEIMKMANVNTSSIKRQSAMYAKLRDSGMVRFSRKVDDLSVQVLFAEEGDAAVNVSDFRNLGYQYMRLYQAGYYVCENCGLVLKDPHHPGQNCRPRKYCDDCAVKIRVRQQVESVMRRRANLA